MKHVVLSLMLVGVLSSSRYSVYAMSLQPPNLAQSKLAETMFLPQVWRGCAALARRAHLTEWAKSLEIGSVLIGVGGLGLVEGSGLYFLTAVDDIERLAKLDVLEKSSNVLIADVDDIAAALAIEPEEAQRVRLLYNFVWDFPSSMFFSDSTAETLLAAYEQVLPDLAGKLREVKKLQPDKMPRKLEQEEVQDNRSFLRRIFAPIGGKPKTTSQPTAVEQQDTGMNEQLGVLQEELVDMWLQALAQTLDLDLHFTPVAGDNDVPEILGIVQAQARTGETQQLQSETDKTVQLVEAIRSIHRSVAQEEVPTVEEVQSSIDGDREVLNKYIMAVDFTNAFTNASNKKLPWTSHYDAKTLESAEKLLVKYEQAFSAEQLQEMREAVDSFSRWNYEREQNLSGQRRR